jgi:uncharacterized oxidoreductase
MVPQGATYLITGASSGLGFELSKRLASSGSKVIAVGRNASRLDVLAAISSNITAVSFDISDIDQIGSFAERMIQEHPSISVLINNAGISENLRFDEAGYQIAQIEAEIRTNLTAPICLAHAFFPHLVAQQASTIVNVSSGLAYIPKQTAAVYSATKAGLHLFSDGLQVQMQDSNLSVCEVILPMLDTPMTAGRGSGKVSVEQAASEIIKAMEKGEERIFIGKSRLLPFLLRWFPGVARSAMQKPD